MSARIQYTPSQREAIRRQAHTLIAAGAGSGKTTTIVAKILHALGARVLPGEAVTEPCALHEIAAITFTNAAAADLKRDLRDALRAHAASSGDPAWLRMTYDVDRARIGTIHSFCGQLLREFGIRAGLDPAFRILDEAETAALCAECAERALYDALGEGDADADALLWEYGPAATTDIIDKVVRRAEQARRAAARWCDGDGARVEELRAAVRESGAEWRDHDEDSARLAATAIRLGLAARERLDRALEAERALDYDALILRARDLLADRPDVLAAVRRRLAWLFIDEFQDTDPAQTEIAYRICRIGERRAGAERPWLCVVGDPKQSIYRFRRADVALWGKVTADLAACGCEPIPLDVNYRSRQPLLAYVNATFGRVMAPAVGEAHAAHEVSYAALTAKHDWAGDDGLVELLALPGDESADERRRIEADLIARRILAMVKGDAIVRRKEEDEARAPSWRDVALLFQARTSLAIYEEALRRYGIPYYVSGGDGFFARREVRDVRLLLAALCDERDDLAWAGLFRSPFVGLTDAGLYRLRLALPHAPLSSALGAALPDEDGERLAIAAGWLGELRRLRERIGCAALIERAIERSGYAAALLHAPDGSIALANVRKLIAMADGRPDASVAELVEMMVEREDAGQRESEAALHTAGEDVVTLTTIHGAKGLEWPVVFLCDLERAWKAGRRTDDLLFDESLGIGLSMTREYDVADEKGKIKRTKLKSGAWERLAAAEAARDVAEARRVWYVAATRARDRLVICACDPQPEAKDGADPHADPDTVAPWLLSVLGRDGDRLVYSYGDGRWSGRIVRELPSGEEVAPYAPPTVAEIRGERVAELAARTGEIAGGFPLLRRSATELLAFASDPAEHRQRYVLGLRPLVAPGAMTAGAGNGSATIYALDARAVGDVVHGVLEEARLESDLDALLEREVRRTGGDAAAARLGDSGMRALRGLVGQAWSHAAVQRLHGGEAVERELPFTWLVAAGGETFVVHGAMDLVARVDGAIEVLDFKSHANPAGREAEIAESYAIQRDVYAAALGEILAAPGAFSFLFPSTGVEVREDAERARFEGAADRVRSLIAGLSWPGIAEN